MTRVLIANRGEIAVRIADAAALSGLESLAVFAADDIESPHRVRADRSLPLKGEGPMAYLDGEALLAAALAQSCDLVHPGYGFLSEHADFADAVEHAGLTFVGPTAATLRLLGDKAQARAFAAEHQIPILDGATGSREELRLFHRSHGVIVLKATSGGGGRGMRVVTAAEDFDAAVDACAREAELSFGTGTLYAERFLPGARHIEVQILGDGRGEALHAGDRECSLQRRHQKLIEVAPSPSLDPVLRSTLHRDAVRLAAACGFRGIGTIEFLVTGDGQHFFIEANPRLQVEHTVTEEAFGIDLVAIQFSLATGGTLPRIPEARGTSIQARVYLETLELDGSRRPSAGVVQHYRPPLGKGVRVDDGIVPGMGISPRYDPLAAKIIGTGATFHEARLRLLRALDTFELDGVAHNVGLLKRILAEPAFQHQHVDTEWLESNLPRLLESQSTPEASHQNSVTAPTAGTVVYLQADGPVRAGTVLARIEAMKMEFEVKASVSGVLRQRVLVGALVAEGERLADLEPVEEEATSAPEETAVDLDAIRSDLAESVSRHERTLDAARASAVSKRHRRGQRTARENLEDLFDEGSFSEYGALVVAGQRQVHPMETLFEISPADGLITGTGTVAGSPCAAMAYDYTVMAGTQGTMNHKKTDRLLAMAKEWQMPLVCFAEGGGGRPSDTDHPGAAWLDVPTFAAMADLADRVPTVGIAGGYCFAGNAALFGCCDLTIATRKASIGMAGPAMIEGGGLGRFRPEDVGPAETLHRCGVVDVLVDDEAAAVAATQRFLGLVTGVRGDGSAADQRALRHAVPENRKRVYDIRQLVRILVDEDSTLELRRGFAPSGLTALARVGGIPIGVIANDPQHQGGAINADTGDKFSRFMRLCDTHGLPILSLCDTPGFMVGPESERDGAVRRVSQMFLAGAKLTVPLVAIVLRKAYGLGAMAMAGGGFGRPVLSASWPSGEFGAMGIEGAVRLGARRQLEAIADAEEREAKYQRLVDERYEAGKALNVASYLELDAVIDPAETRDWILRALQAGGRSPYEPS